MKKLVGLLLVLIFVLALSACGTKKEVASIAAVEPTAASGTTEAATELQLKASDKTFQFDKKEYTIKKGEKIKLTLVNESGTHGLSISGLGVKLNSAQMSQTITPEKAGTYTIKCIVPCGSGHMTMTAKLIVA